MGLRAGVGAAHGLELGRREHAGAAPFHLLEIDAAADIAQEEQALERLDVGAGGDHVHGDGDAELRRGAELGDQVLALFVAFRLGVPRLVGDLFGEVIAAAEDFAHEVDDVLRVRVVLGENEGLWHELAAGEKVGEKRVLERLEDSADLRLHDNGAVEVLCGEREVFIKSLPADAPRLLMPAIDIPAFLDLAALLGDLRFDPIDFVADVHAIGDGALVIVFGDEVLIEEADSLLARCRGEADEEGVEVFEDLPPEVVDGAVAFIGNDEVEGLDQGWRGCRRRPS